MFQTELLVKGLDSRKTWAAGSDYSRLTEVFFILLLLKTLTQISELSGFFKCFL